MGIEIERKFLVNKEIWEKYKPTDYTLIKQGYLLNQTDFSIRIRVRGEKGFLTIKGKTTSLSRPEYEYEIPVKEAIELLQQHCTKWIDKKRYEIKVGNHIWEVDEFIHPKKGLILAEIELSSEQETFLLPDWITEEVSGQVAYYNANMLK